MNVDPVCGMTVDPASAPSFAYSGQTYYFCCPHCLQKFQADPQQYLKATLTHFSHSSTQHSALSTQHYFCPMDPEVVSDRPGVCPKCGMALEARVVSVEEGPN